MSGNFSSTVPGEKIQPVHINDNKAFRLAENKPQLYKTLEKNKFPIGKNAPYNKFTTNGSFQLGDFEDTFEGYEDPGKGVQFLHPNQSIEINDMEELLALLNSAGSDQEKAVLVQSLLENPQTGFVRGIPNARGISLNNGNRDVKDGILAHNVPKNLKKKEEITNTMLDALDTTGLDYGTVLFKFDPETEDFEIVDITTHLSRADAVALRSYADKLYQANKRHTIDAVIKKGSLSSGGVHRK